MNSSINTVPINPYNYSNPTGSGYFPASNSGIPFASGPISYKLGGEVSVLTTQKFGSIGFCFNINGIEKSYLFLFKEPQSFEDCENIIPYCYKGMLNIETVEGITVLNMKAGTLLSWELYDEVK